MSAMTLDDLLEESGKMIAAGELPTEAHLVSWRQALAIHRADHAQMVEKVREAVGWFRGCDSELVSKAQGKAWAAFLSNTIGDAK